MMCGRQRFATVVVTAAIGIAVVFVPSHEGRNLVAYLDPIGIPTICEGWTRGVQLGDVATDAQCDDLTQRGLLEADAVFQRWVPESVRANMPASAYAMFLSFIYNVGPGGHGVKDGFVWLKSGRHSSMLLQLQAGNIVDACQQLPAWVTAGGRKLRGLERRRAEEMRICLSDLS
ncbi:MAG: lysozyme [Corticimicrobacter sp.]|uniref:lysozyme n=1 Tax=Corticimicrobacter sp. TaxID=2678536 RepID=UPI0032DA9C47